MQPQPHNLAASRLEPDPARRARQALEHQLYEEEKIRRFRSILKPAEKLLLSTAPPRTRQACAEVLLQRLTEAKSYRFSRAVKRLRRDPEDKRAASAIGARCEKLRTAIDNHEADMRPKRGRPAHEPFNSLADALADFWIRGGIDPLDRALSKQALSKVALSKKAYVRCLSFITEALPPLHRHGIRFPSQLDRALRRRLTEKRKKWDEYLVSR